MTIMRNLVVTTLIANVIISWRSIDVAVGGAAAFTPSIISFHRHHNEPRFHQEPLRMLISPSSSSSSSNSPSRASSWPSTSSLSSSSTRLHAKPMRLKENVDGVLYVNDKCINCAACSAFAPASFRRSESTDHHVVYQQPNLNNAKELLEARQALAACPVAAIRIETLAERRHTATTIDDKQAVESSWTMQDDELVKRMTSKDSSLSSSSSSSTLLFPRPFLDDMDDVYWIGHHNDKSFGAIPYLLRTTNSITNNNKNETIWIMIDTPRFSKSAVKEIESLTGPMGPQYLFLSHVDDTADHGKWAAHYPGLQRIFNAGDLGRHNWLGDLSLETVEILLQPPPTTSDDSDDTSSSLSAYSLSGQLLPRNWMEVNTDEVVILHTPGHSPGSMTLYRRPSSSSSSNEADGNMVNKKPGILFTGDTYAYTTTRHGERKMTGFPRYGNDLTLQAKIVGKLLDLDWQVIAPGHGHSRDYRDNSSSKMMQQIREEEVLETQQELRMYPSRRRG